MKPNPPRGHGTQPGHEKGKLPRSVARKMARAQAARKRAGTPGRGEFPVLVRSLPEIDLGLSGARGTVLQAENHQVAFLEFSADTYIPPHRHRAQWEIIVNGEVDLRIGEHWRTCESGESFWIPEGIEHEALVKKGYRSIVIFDQKDRYRTKQKAAGVP